MGRHCGISLKGEVSLRNGSFFASTRSLSEILWKWGRSVQPHRKIESATATPIKRHYVSRFWIRHLKKLHVFGGALHWRSKLCKKFSGNCFCNALLSAKDQKSSQNSSEPSQSMSEVCHRMCTLKTMSFRVKGVIYVYIYVYSGWEWHLNYYGNYYVNGNSETNCHEFGVMYSLQFIKHQRLRFWCVSALEILLCKTCAIEGKQSEQKGCHKYFVDEQVRGAVRARVWGSHQII